MKKYKKKLSTILFGVIICLTISTITFCGNEQNMNIVYAANSKNIMQAIEGSYSVDYQARGEYLDNLQKTYGSKVVIENGYLNGWRLNVEDIVKVSESEYIVTCAYLLKGIAYPPPMVEAKLIVYLSTDMKAKKIEHKEFVANKWPDGEWKANMIFYRQ